MNVLCLGDSNTYGYDPRSYLGGRYPARVRWTELLARKTGWETVNAGENGREIPRREYELKQIGRMLSEHSPDRLVVMLGTNDLLQGASAQDASARMEAFLTRLPLDGERILLIAPPPLRASEWVAQQTLITASVRLAECYRALAARRGIRFADAGEWHIRLAFDGIHFTEEGHASFAEGVFRALTA